MDSTTHIDLMAKIAAIRRAKKITQQEIAQKLNVSTMSISMWERRERTPPVEIFEKWCEALGARIDISIDL